MPIYEYRCKECHQIFEDWSSQSGDAAPRFCPICNSQTARMSASASFAPGGKVWHAGGSGCESKELGQISGPAPAGRNNPA